MKLFNNNGVTNKKIYNFATIFLKTGRNCEETGLIDNLLLSVGGGQKMFYLLLLDPIYLIGRIRR